MGDGLNKALSALEEANTALEGVVQHIDFTRKVGQSSISDKKLRDLIVHFSKYPLRMRTSSSPTSSVPPTSTSLASSLTRLAKRVVSSIRPGPSSG